jgi:hypothetical protein
MKTVVEVQEWEIRQPQNTPDEAAACLRLIAVVVYQLTKGWFPSGVE